MQAYLFLNFLQSMTEMLYTYVKFNRFNPTFGQYSSICVCAMNLFIIIFDQLFVYNSYYIIINGYVYNMALENQVYVFFQLLMWIRIISYLKLTSNYGYIVKIIEIVVFKMFNFIILFTIIILAFASIFYTLL